jgi:23S rRNA (cytosine1962-C5)-methyltransferase
MIVVHLQKGKDKPIRMGHPWVFSGAVGRVEGNGPSGGGEVCTVVAAGGETLGCGFYNETSAIRVRMLTRGKELFDARLLAQRIADAVALRSPVLSGTTDSCRLVNSEGDRLPGLIVDKYATGLCVQVLTAGMERLRPQISDTLAWCCAPEYIYERSDTEARLREGLSEQEGILSGTLPPESIVTENGLRFYADIGTGQKTGFFLDQRENRNLFPAYAAGKTICDCFSYSGGFSVNGLARGAKSATLVDISNAALDCARKNCTLNRLDPACCEFVCADVFDYLRRPETAGRFGCIVLDPPKFARHKGEIDRAARGYKDINLSAMKIIEPNGVLFTFSCSNAIDPTLFRQIVFAAAADSQRPVQVLHTLGAGPDHPFNIAHREGEYLKGLVLRVI